MPKRTRDKGSAQVPMERPAKRSPQEVYDYWTDEMMGAAVPVELDRKPARRKGKGETDDGKPS